MRTKYLNDGSGGMGEVVSSKLFVTVCVLSTIVQLRRKRHHHCAVAVSVVGRRLQHAVSRSDYLALSSVS